MKCSDCGAKNPAGAKFCGACGSEITSAQKGGTAVVTPWDNTFKWIGMIVVGIFVLAFLSNL